MEKQPNMPLDQDLAGAPEVFEQGEARISGDVAASSYRGDKERFVAWLDQEQELIAKGPKDYSYRELFFEQKLARIQFAAGEVDDAVQRLDELAYRAQQEASQWELPRQGITVDEKERVRRFYEMLDFQQAAYNLAREYEQGART